MQPPLNKVARKEQREFEIFKRFVERSQIPVVADSIRNCPPPEPDILCELKGEGIVRFELAEACAPEFAEAIINPRQKGVYCTFGSDVSLQTVQRKLTKQYPVDDPIELLIYTDGGTAKPDFLLIYDIQDACEGGNGQFRRIWLMGQDIHEVVPCPS